MGILLALVGAAAPPSRTVCGAAFAAVVSAVPTAAVWLRRGGADQWATAVGSGVVGTIVAALFLVVGGAATVGGPIGAVGLVLVLIGALARPGHVRSKWGRAARARAESAGTRVRSWVVSGRLAHLAGPGRADQSPAERGGRAAVGPWLDVAPRAGSAPAATPPGSHTPAPGLAPESGAGLGPESTEEARS